MGRFNGNNLQNKKNDLIMDTGETKYALRMQSIVSHKILGDFSKSLHVIGKESHLFIDRVY